MPEISTLRPYNLPAVTSAPIAQNYFDRSVPQVVPDLTQAARVAGQSALMGQIATDAAKLPDIIINGVRAGKRFALEDKANALKDKMLSGEALTPEEEGALSGVTIDDKGGVNYKGRGVLSYLDTMAANADIAHKNAMTNYYNHRSLGGTGAGSLYDKLAGAAPDLPTDRAVGPGSSANDAVLRETTPGALGPLHGNQDPESILSPNPDGALAGDENELPPVDENAAQSQDVKSNAPPLPNGGFTMVKPSKPGEPILLMQDGKTVGFVPPGGNSWHYLPKETEAGITYPSVDAAKADGVDPTGAKLNADGSVTISKVAKESKPRLSYGTLSEMGKTGFQPDPDATPAQAMEAWEKHMLDRGQVPPHLIPALQTIQQKVSASPTLKGFLAAQEAKHTLDASLEQAAKDPNGIADMGIIEGLQRIVNPNAAVRQGTIQNMQQAIGWLNQYNPNFAWDKATDGAKLTPAAREHVRKLAEDAFARDQKEANRAVEGAKRQAVVLGVNPSLADQFLSAAFATLDPDEPTPSIAPSEPGMATMQIGDQTGTIPEGKVQEFLQKYPNAKRIK